MPAQRLQSGRFYGGVEACAAAAGFSLAKMRATVPPEDVKLHTHAQAHLVFVFAGEYISSAAGAPEVAESPLVIYNPPGVVHRDRFQQASGRFLTITVDSGNGEDQLSLPNHAQASDAPLALLLARRLVLGCSVGEEPVELESSCLELIASFAARRDPAKRGTPDWLRSFRQALDDRWKDDASIRELAREAGAHPVYVARAFRSAYGTSPAEHRRARRVAAAAGMLEQRRRSLAEIAAECGYADQSHFTRAFRRAIGVSPGDYRAAAGGH